MRFVSIPTRDLLRRPMRTLLTVIGIAAAVGAFVSLVGLSRGIMRAWRHQLRDKDTHLLAVRRGTIDVLSASVAESLAAQIREFPGVQHASGELGHLVTLETGDVGLLVGWEPDSYLCPSGSRPDGVVVGQEVAALLGKKVGDSLKLVGETFPIVGVTKATGVFHANSVFMLLQTMQELLQREGKVTGFNVRVERPDDPRALDLLRQRLDAAFPDLTFHETGKVGENNRALWFIDAMAWSTSTVALAIGLVVLLNTLLMSVAERTREIGILRAVGWSGARILALIVLESLGLAAVGSVMGVLLGLGGFELLSRAPMVRSFVEPAVDARLLLEVIGAALALGVFGGLYPAWRATRLDPVAALRYE